MIKTYFNEKITLGAKGQKIVAAIYVVTQHLPESDPLRQKIRALAVSLCDCSEDERKIRCIIMQELLESALIARLIHEQNARIIAAELKYFAEPIADDASIRALFPTQYSNKGHIPIKRTNESVMSFNSHKDNIQNEKNIAIPINKAHRQEKILTIINDRKSTSIKDIALLFPEVSEKTIQRELGVLVASGKIRKQGSKRWSLYFSVNA